MRTDISSWWEAVLKSIPVKFDFALHFGMMSSKRGIGR